MKQIAETAADAGVETRMTVTKTGGAVATLMEQMAADAGAGEQFDGKDLAVPFLSILQSNSPQVSEADPKYVEGAKPGMVFNTVSGKVYDTRVLASKPGSGTPLPVVFCGFNRMMVEWLSDRGGFLGQHLPESPAVKACVPGEKRNSLKTPTGNDMVNTIYEFPVVCDDEDFPAPAIIGLTSTQLKKGSRLNSFVNDLKIPIDDKGNIFRPKWFQLLFNIRTVAESNAQGDWWGWEFQYVGLVAQKLTVNPEKVYKFAQKYYADIAAGVVKTDKPPTDPDNVPF